MVISLESRRATSRIRKGNVMYLAPNLVLGSNKIGTHSPEEVLVGAAEDAVLVLRDDELRPPSPPPVSGPSYNRTTERRACTNPYDTNFSN